MVKPKEEKKPIDWDAVFSKTDKMPAARESNPIFDEFIKKAMEKPTDTVFKVNAEALGIGDSKLRNALATRIKENKYPLKVRLSEKAKEAGLYIQKLEAYKPPKERKKKQAS